MRRMAVLAVCFIGTMCRADNAEWLKQTLKQTEALRLKAYPDSGYKAIGYGHRVSTAGPDVCTVAQANRWLDQDVNWFSEVVKNAVSVPLTRSQREALVSFAFNIGPVGFRRSEVVNRLNKGLYLDAVCAMAKYNKSQGKRCKGLVKRRKLEILHFLGVDNV
jgi:lysozyme